MYHIGASRGQGMQSDTIINVESGEGDGLLKVSLIPLFWRLTPENQVKLMQFYWDNFGLRLEIPPEPKDTHIETILEPPEEIDKIMRQSRDVAR